MRLEIARLHQRLGTTTVYVTHDQVEAMTLADRIVVMNGGAHPAGGLAHGALRPAPPTASWRASSARPP
jgi:ABC-type Fe3+/spermidine/putrescine transport system ATPase subunit